MLVQQFPNFNKHVCHKRFISRQGILNLDWIFDRKSMYIWKYECGVSRIRYREIVSTKISDDGHGYYISKAQSIKVSWSNQIMVSQSMLILRWPPSKEFPVRIHSASGRSEKLGAQKVIKGLNLPTHPYWNRVKVSVKYWGCKMQMHLLNPQFHRP